MKASSRVADGHRALRRAGKWQPYDSDAEIVPGIKPVSYGKTPGHAGA